MNTLLRGDPLPKLRAPSLGWRSGLIFVVSALVGLLGTNCIVCVCFIGRCRSLLTVLRIVGVSSLPPVKYALAQCDVETVSALLFHWHEVVI
jgi:hypothetical protein